MQCSSKILDYVKRSKCQPLAITYVLSLNHHRSIAWSMTVCLSIRRGLSLSTCRRGCWQTHSCSVANVLQSTGQKSDMLRSHTFCSIVQFGVSRRSSLAVVRTRGAGVLCCWKLSWFSAFDFMKNMKYVCNRRFTEVHACQKLSKIELDLTKLLQKWNRAVLSTHMLEQEIR